MSAHVSTIYVHAHYIWLSFVSVLKCESWLSPRFSSSCYTIVPCHVKEKKILTLEERVAVLKKADERKSWCATEIEVGAGKTQIQTIVKKRDYHTV